MALPQGSPASTGVIFDLDGTLADTLDDITDTLNAVLSEFGYAPVSRAHARRLIGEGLSVLLKRASQERDPDRVTELTRRYRVLYQMRLVERTRLYDGIPEVLDELTVRGVPMCVLSNKPHEFTVPICSALLHRWRFRTVQGARADAPRKPDPTFALRLCERMSLPPADVVFVGDSDVDVATARNAGMVAVAVTWGFRDRARLENAAPDVVVDTPAQLSEWLRR